MKMRKRYGLFLHGSILASCAFLFVQSVSGGYYPGPREKVEGLGVWSWVFFAVSACLFMLGFMCLRKRHAILGDAVAGISIIVGSFLTIVGLFKIPSSTLSISQSSSSPSGIVATRYILNDPIMAPIGIGLIIMAAAVIIISKRRRHITPLPPIPPPP
jgi:drug/metabolite transporter (DMT)-like permease